MSVFDFVNAINSTKENLLTENNKKEYNTFIVNKALSYNVDTVLYANEMNKSHIDSDMQFNFLLNAVPKKKRYNKWVKKSELSNDIRVIQEYYKYNTEKAEAVLSLISETQLSLIKQQMEKGGNP